MAIGAQDKEQKTQQLAAGEHLLRSNPQAAKNLAGHYNNIGAGSTKENGNAPAAPDFSGFAGDLKKVFPRTWQTANQEGKALENSSGLQSVGNAARGIARTAGAMIVDTAAGVANPFIEIGKGFIGTPANAKPAGAKPAGAKPAGNVDDVAKQNAAHIQNFAIENGMLPVKPGETMPLRALPDSAGNLAALQSDDVTLARYNAQQAANGTGITVQRQPDGTLAFSGRGTGDSGGMAMNPAASGNINMQSGTDAYARALAIRQGMSGGNAGAAMPGLPAAQREVVGIESPRDDGREAIMKAAMTPYKNSPNGQLTARQLEIAKGIAEGAQRERMQAAQNAQNAQNQAAKNAIDAQKLGLDQQAFNLAAAKQGMELQSLARLNALQQAAMNAKTPEERKAASETLLALQGKAPGETGGFNLLQEMAKAALNDETLPLKERAALAAQFAQGNFSGVGQQQAPTVGGAQLKDGDVVQGADGRMYKKQGNNMVPVE